MHPKFVYDKDSHKLRIERRKYLVNGRIEDNITQLKRIYLYVFIIKII